ncbi:MAG: family ATPase [Thermoleophilia bacterium]|jgi:predicted AAA+ superfamily ATPase|nr:family ATPase [Thermoleophilia bacterium]
MTDYRRRIIDDELDALMTALPAVAVEGAKGVGKTASAERRAQTSWRLDDPVRRAIAAADPARVLAGEPPVLLDEWQRLPEVWDAVRRAVDDGAPAGRFLLTGSAAPTAPAMHSGAGRIASVRMRPLALAERELAPTTVSLTELLSGSSPAIGGASTVDLQGYADEIVRSGFPGMRMLTGRALRAQLDAYVDRLAERDFVELGHRVRSPQALRRWMVAYAAATATCASYETIRDAATSGEGDKPAKSTTQPYRQTLEQLFLVEPVPGWAPTRNRIARLAQPPKHHLVDPALAARLLGVDASALLDAVDAGPPMPRDGSLLGSLFESLVTQSVRVYAQQAEARVGHLRTKGGDREVDLIVERADGRVVAIEVKLAARVDDADVRHLSWLREQIGDDLLDAVVVTTGIEAYRRADGIAVVPAALLGA